MAGVHWNRRCFIGGSDARIIMGSDEAALIRLWREKRGDILEFNNMESYLFTCKTKSRCLTIKRSTGAHDYVQMGIRLLELSKKAYFYTNSKIQSKSKVCSISCVRTRYGKIKLLPRRFANRLIYLQ